MLVMGNFHDNMQGFRPYNYVALTAKIFLLQKDSEIILACFVPLILSIYLQKAFMLYTSDAIVTVFDALFHTSRKCNIGGFECSNLLASLHSLLCDSVSGLTKLSRNPICMLQSLLRFQRL